MKKSSKIPQFKTKEEEATWWETHNIADYQDEFETVKVRFAKKLSEGITIRFDEPTLDKIRKIAHEKGIGPTMLAKSWILKNLKQQAYK